MHNLNLNINRFGASPIVHTTGYVDSYIDGNYQVLEFYYVSGSPAEAFNGTGSFVLPQNRQVEYLVVAGGGSGAKLTGGVNTGEGGGGGGAGGLLSGSFYGLGGSRYNVLVGAGGYIGGSTAYKSGSNGSPSSLVGQSHSGLFTYTTTGGGGGGGIVNEGGGPIVEFGPNGQNGGSGGGAGAAYGTGPVGASGVIGSGSVPEGNNGGYAAVIGVELMVGGGGGGATTVGTNGVVTGQRESGNGGSGSFSMIKGGTGSWFAGGGGAGWERTAGSTDYNIWFGNGGIGGGGQAWSGSRLVFNSDPATIKGQERTGGGGAVTGNGGSGVVIVRWNIYNPDL